MWFGHLHSNGGVSCKLLTCLSLSIHNDCTIIDKPPGAQSHHPNRCSLFPRHGESNLSRLSLTNSHGAVTQSPGVGPVSCALMRV